MYILRNNKTNKVFTTPIVDCHFDTHQEALDAKRKFAIAATHTICYESLFEYDPVAEFDKIMKKVFI